MEEIDAIFPRLRELLAPAAKKAAKKLETYAR